MDIITDIVWEKDLKFNDVLVDLDSNIIQGNTFFEINSTLVNNVNRLDLFTSRGFYTKTIVYEIK